MLQAQDSTRGLHTLCTEKPESMKYLQQAPHDTLEGNALSEYHWPSLIASLPGNVLIEVCRRLLAPFFKADEPGETASVPDNAICYLFHGEIFYAIATVKLWQRHAVDPQRPSAYLGFHGFFSYLGSLPFALTGWRTCRYDRRKGERPINVILRYLARHPGKFFMRTDAGGPYYRVKGSVVKLSRASDRPLVPLRQFADRYIVINQHQIPLPGARIFTKIGKPIPAHELRALSDADALMRVQKAMDDLALSEMDATTRSST